MIHGISRKPATAIAANGLRNNSDQLGGKIRFQNTLLDQQTQRLMRRHALTAAAAEILAPFVFGEEVAP
ncbi:MAG TPA: hypothetical protein VIJ35_18715 [Bradyrhizobium sp.]